MGGDGSYTSDQLERALDISVAVLERHRLPYALGFGTLLGHVRDGRMIDGDDDVDIFVETKHFSNAVLAMKSHFPEKVSLLESPYFRCFMVQGVQVDLYSLINEDDRDCYVCWENQVFPSNIMFPFRKRGKYMLPSRPESALVAMYGEDWRTPQDGKFYTHVDVEKSRVMCTRAKVHLSPLGVSCTAFLSIIILLVLLLVVGSQRT